MKVDKKIYDLIKFYADGGMGYDLYTDSLDDLRDAALNAIRIYRENKKRIEEKEKELQVYKKFLDIIEPIEPENNKP